MTMDTITTKLAELETKCAYHDWYYDYSDDHSVWKRGVASRDAILTLRAELVALGAKEQADEIFYKHCPKS